MSNFTQIDTLKAKAGDILRIAPRQFILVITPDRIGKGFYYVRCSSMGGIKKYSWDRNDNVSAANYINHSNMLGVSRELLKLEITRNIELQTKTVVKGSESYQWWLTGDRAIDAYMANLDARYALFSNHATDADLNEYARNEDRNCHSVNGNAVARFGEAA